MLSALSAGIVTADIVLRSATTGIQKLDSLSKFFDSVIDGTADLRIANQEAAQEEFVPDPAELEIERRQEEEKMRLAHGGFADMAEFEEAVKAGHGANFHAKNGYPGMMGGLPKGHGEQSGAAKDEDPMHETLKAQKEAADRSGQAAEMDKTDEDGEQVVMKAPSSEQSHTPAPLSTEAAAVEDETSTVATSPPSAEETAASVTAEPAETARAKDEL